MIVVAGGSGRLGSRVVKRLRARNLPVRVLARGAASSRDVVNAGAEMLTGDVRDPAVVRDALDGATVVVSAVQGFAGPGRVSPASVDGDGNANLVNAAASSGADVVMMSVVGASPTNPMELFRAKSAAEEQLRATRVPATIVRATAFAEMWAEIMKKPIVFGRGENPINFVSVDEVADVVVRAATDNSLRGSCIEVGGPADLSFNEFAARLRDVRGESKKTKHVPRALLRAMAPVSRQAAAGYAMDTIDMTFGGNASSEAERVITPPLPDSVFSFASKAAQDIDPQ
jgi:NADH dehydrogenase